MRSTHTYVILEISPEAHAEIKAKLLAADYGHAIDGETIDMHGIALQPGGEPEIAADRNGDRQLSAIVDRVLHAQELAGIVLSRAVLGEPTVQVHWPDNEKGIPLSAIREHYPEGVVIDRHGNLSGDPVAIEEFKTYCRALPMLRGEAVGVSCGSNPISVGSVKDHGWIDTRLPTYTETQKRIGYGGITLVREGNYAVVKIEHEGREIEVIREVYDGNFSHNVSSIGIEAEIKSAVQCQITSVEESTESYEASAALINDRLLNLP
jgi:hypothetical protein